MPFCAHVGEGKEFESPYISLTDDPGRAFKFGQYLSEQNVFVMDAAKLPGCDKRVGFKRTG
jgi:hypothetical protein